MKDRQQKGSAHVDREAATESDTGKVADESGYCLVS
jgi:hypothetical protein